MAYTNRFLFCFFAVALLGLAGCSSGDGITIHADGGSTSVAGGGGTGGGGVTPPPTPIPDMRNLASFGSTSGGVGRLSPMQLDGKEAVVTFASRLDTSVLLNDPNAAIDTHLIDIMNGADFTYGDMSMLTRPSIGGTEAEVRARDNRSLTMSGISGTLYPVYLARASNVYIDDFAPVVLFYDAVGRILTIGEPFAASNLPSGEQVYSGVGTLNVRGARAESRDGTFRMVADFTAMTADFDVVFDFTETAVTASGVTLNLMDGTITGMANFIAAGSGGLFATDSTGPVYGQFHGEASAVSGIYQNGANGNDLVYGGFAGSKE